MSKQQSPVQVGIAGLGRSGWGIHAGALAEIPEMFTVAAVCDPDAGRQAEARERFGCRSYENFAQLVNDDAVELLIVATPSQHHQHDTITALQAGKHVVVEKPMGRDLDEVDAMLAAAHATGQLLTVFQNYRYASDFLKVRKILDSGVLGRILQIRIAAHSFSRRWDWQTLKQNGGGMLNNHGAHMVDWALQLLDEPEPTVFCRMETTPLYAGDAESHAKVILQPPQGPTIDIELTSACAYPQGTWLVMGTQGGLRGTRKSLQWKYFVPEEVPPLVLDTQPMPDRSYNHEQLPWHEESYEVVNLPGNNAQHFYHDLYAALREDAPLAVTPESVRRQMAILEQCRALSPI